MSRFHVHWICEITTHDTADHNAALRKVTADATARKSIVGEVWAVNDNPETNTVRVETTYDVDDLDAAA